MQTFEQEPLPKKTSKPASRKKRWPPIAKFGVRHSRKKAKRQNTDRRPGKAVFFQGRALPPGGGKK